mmetsp:Transcript_917/g.3564  ORF Transcript_917/g.3564 Transcript_917/m.3564 type:complete len:287 (-) Transcript_917:72-932(-)
MKGVPWQHGTSSVRGAPEHDALDLSLGYDPPLDVVVVIRLVVPPGGVHAEPEDGNGRGLGRRLRDGAAMADGALSPLLLGGEPDGWDPVVVTLLGVHGVRGHGLLLLLLGGRFTCRGRGGGLGILGGLRAELYLGNRLAHGDDVRLRDEDLLDDAGSRGADVDGDLVGLNLDHNLVLAHSVAWGFHHRGDLSLRNGVSHLGNRYCDAAGEGPSPGQSPLTQESGRGSVKVGRELEGCQATGSSRILLVLGTQAEQGRSRCRACPLCEAERPPRRGLDGPRRGRART